jgi:hypothetical protein
MSEWITDRKPTEFETSNGKVWAVNKFGDVAMVNYDVVEIGTPWQVIPKPEPYVEAKRWTVEWHDRHEEWYLYDGKKEWDRLDRRLTQDAAQRIANIYNEVLP